MVNLQKPPELTIEDWEQTPPAVQAFIAQTLKQAEGTSLTRPRSPADSNPHLLVVDDNEMNRDMLSRRLKRQGYQVATATNGRQALDMLRQEKFDLMLLDIMMPEMNGYQVLEHMQMDTTLRHIPVIVITAVDELESIVRCIEMGAEDYLPKPFNPVLLKARIEASLEKKRLRDLQQAYMLQLDLENKRKSDELEQARQIQLSMLPAAPPRLPHLEIAADQKTASEVGGDYYDFFPQESGKLLATIGDATGHGVGPGLMVSMTKASLLATDQTDLLPLLNKINFILNETALSKQLNMALLLLELSAPVDGCVMARASGGGMPPIYVLRAGGALEEIMIAGLPLGIIHGVRYDLTEFCLSAGDVVLLMSDGLSEIFNAQRQFLGYNRMIAALKEIDPAQLTAVEILRQVEAIGTNWAQGHPLYDDVTLVVIRVLG